MKNIFLLKVLLTLSSPVCKAFQSSEGIFQSLQTCKFSRFWENKFSETSKTFLAMGVWDYGIFICNIVFEIKRRKSSLFN